MPPRAAAMPPTRRSTRSCRWACSCRTDDADVRHAIQIARELKVPVLPRGGGTSQCGQTGRRPGDRRQQAPAQRAGARRASSHGARVDRALVLDHLNAQLKGMACGSRSTCRPARRPRSAAWRATTRAARARIAYGNMVHNVLGATPAAGRRRRTARFGPLRLAGRARSRHRPASCVRWPTPAAARSRRTGPR